MDKFPTEVSSKQDRSELFFVPESRDVRDTGDKFHNPTSSTLARKNRQSYRVQMYPFVTNRLSTGMLCVTGYLGRRRYPLLPLQHALQIPVSFMYSIRHTTVRQQFASLTENFADKMI